MNPKTDLLCRRRSCCCCYINAHSVLQSVPVHFRSELSGLYLCWLWFPSFSPPPPHFCCCCWEEGGGVPMCLCLFVCVVLFSLAFRPIWWLLEFLSSFRLFLTQLAFTETLMQTGAALTHVEVGVTVTLFLSNIHFQFKLTNWQSRAAARCWRDNDTQQTWITGTWHPLSDTLIPSSSPRKPAPNPFPV